MNRLPRVPSSQPHLELTQDFLGALRTQPWPRAAVFPDPTFPISIFDCFGHPPLDLHRHEDFSELVMIYDGMGTHISPSDEYPIATGDVFVITGETAHGYKDVEGLCLLNIVYDPSWAFRGMQDVRKLPGYHALFHLEPRYRRQHDFQSRLRLPPEQLAKALHLAKAMAGASIAREAGFQFRVRLLFFELVEFLCTRYGRGKHPSSRSLILMDDVIRYLESNYHERITLDRLSRLARMSERSLLLLFNQATGMSPIDYLIHIRVDRAAELLRLGRLSVTEVAYRTGFQDCSYFARQFKRATGLAPSIFAARHRVQPDE